MNMHMPQNIMAETELKNIAAIPYQIVSPANNAPIIGIFQDSLLGSFRFTRENVKFGAKQAMNLLMAYPHVNLDKLEKAMYGLRAEEGQKPGNVTNFQILSQILPPLSLIQKNKQYDDGKDVYCESNNVIEIRNGEMLRGRVDATIKNLIHRIYNDYGYMEASHFIDNWQNVITEYMKTSAFSVGIADLLADAKTKDKIQEIMVRQKAKVQQVMDQVHLGVFENNTSHSNSERFEIEVRNLLNAVGDETGKLVRQNMHGDNRFVTIINSGSKGSPLNLSQMITCVGQTNVEGKRVPYGFDSRTLPHYTKYDDSPNARGFIENSYISGLTAEELFFHAMGGRIGLIDTAVKTSQTGYIQRRLIKGLEDLKVEYDMTVRNNKRKVIQFQYGEDGFDPTKVENQPVKLVSMSLDDIYLYYDFTGLHQNESNLSYIYNAATKSRFGKQKEELKKYCKKYTEMMVKRRKEIVQYVFKGKTDDTVRLPVAFHAMITNWQGQLNLSAQSLVDITPVEVFQKVEAAFERIRSFSFVPVYELFETLFFFYLNPRELLEKKRFHDSAIQVLLESIVLRFKQAIISPGEMVGIVAGQSIGEPTTQLTLNTFHTAGSAKSNATRGVPRIEEILRLTKFPKTPSLTVFLKGEDRFQKEKANAYSKIMRYTKLVNVVKQVEIVFDPVDNRSQLPEDQKLMNQFLEFERLVESSSTESAATFANRSKWIVRLEVDAETLFENNITMDDIDFAIQNSHLGPFVQCVYSDFNSDNLVFRIAVDQAALSKRKAAKALDFNDDIYTLKLFQETFLNNIVLRGVEGIKNVLLREVKNFAFEEDGQFKKKDMWVLDTTGSNLLDVLALDYIDTYKTYTNNISEIFDVLGIEATRQSIFNEMEDVMESSGSIYINYHHLSLLCDRMTANKELVAIFRTGILNDDIGPIAKATFEVQTDEFLKAARHGELDTMRGVSANVMCGQTGYYGTHAFNVLVDMPKFRSLPDNPPPQHKPVQESMKQNGVPQGEVPTIDNGLSQFDVKIATDPCAKSNLLNDDYDMGF